MHPFDIIIVISIACCVGYIPAIYVKTDCVLSAGYFVGSAVGAFAGSYLALWYLPAFGKPGLLFGGLSGAIALVGVWHFLRKDWDRDPA